MIEVKQQQLDGMHPDTFAIGAVRDSIRRDIYELKVFAEILRRGSPMTALNKYAALRQLAEESTRGEWWSDVVETDGEYGDGEDRASGYHSYAVYVGSESLLDMTNSTAACIHTEWDHDYLMAWDETAKRNAEFIAAANPATVLALLDELEAKDATIAFQQHEIRTLLGRLENANRAAAAGKGATS